MELSVRRGEEVHTLGLWLCPPRVLAMPGLEKGRRWREWEGECFCSKEKKWFEMKNERKNLGGGGGGGGCLNRGVKEGERVSPINVHKGVLKLGLKNLE